MAKTDEETTKKAFDLKEELIFLLNGLIDKSFKMKEEEFNQREQERKEELEKWIELLMYNNNEFDLIFMNSLLGKIDEVYGK